MKKLLLFVATIVASSAAFAQSSLNINSDNNQPLLQNVNVRATSGSSFMMSNTSSVGKSSGFSDTMYGVTNAQVDSLFGTGRKLYYYGAVQPFDSGYIFGLNPLNFTGFADWFYGGPYNPDTTIRILGVVAEFGGFFQPTTTKTVNFKIWGVDTTKVTISTTRKVRDLPKTTNVLGSINNVSIKNLGINVGTGADSLKFHFFSSPITGVGSSFYVGYEINYPWSGIGTDTIGMYSTTIGSGWGSGQYYVSNPDTIIFAQTAIKDNAGVWKDAFMSYGLNPINLSIVPVYQLVGTSIWPSDVAGITKGNLTFAGHYPNPATSSLNVKFSVANATSVSVKLMDMTGKTVAEVASTKYAVGQHTASLETANLASGNYIYMIRTAEGDAFAAQIAVTK